MAVTGLAWHPKGKEEIAFVNKGGEFGTMIDFLKVAPDATKDISKEVRFIVILLSNLVIIVSVYLLDKCNKTNINISKIGL